MIQGTWGLGEMVVDGTATPDNWLVSRANLRIQQETIAHKEVRLVLAPGTPRRGEQGRGRARKPAQRAQPVA